MIQMTCFTPLHTIRVWDVPLPYLVAKVEVQCGCLAQHAMRYLGAGAWRKQYSSGSTTKVTVL